MHPGFAFCLTGLSAILTLAAPLLAAEPDAKALAHGREQVFQMLKDRPEMTTFRTANGRQSLSMDDPQVQWLIRKFAGEDFGRRIYWVEKPPMDRNEAEHNTVGADGRPFICVARVGFPITVTTENAFEVMWSGAIFELLNICGTNEFNALWRKACRGTISKDLYITGMAAVEYRALQRLQAFHRMIWSPWCKQTGNQCDESRWWTALPDTFEDWLAHYKNPEEYPWQPYGLNYDRARGRGR